MDCRELISVLSVATISTVKKYFINLYSLSQLENRDYSLFNISNSTVAVQDNTHLTNAYISRVYHNFSPISIWLSSYCDVNNNYCAGRAHVQLEGEILFHLAISQ